MSAQIQPWPVVHRGAAEHPVTTLQYLLNDRGAGLTVDGRFGPKTEAAVRDVQHDHHLQVDGIVGPKTWPKTIVQVRRGDRRDAVRGVQEEFAFRTGEPGHEPAIDGIFGSQTEALVRGFQGALDLTVDGIVGPLTWRALVSRMLAG